MKKAVYFLLAVVIVAGLTITGCGPKKPQEAVELELLAMQAGTTSYAMAFAMADIVTKNHPWINITAVEGGGSVGNLGVLAQKPEKRSTTLIFTHEASNHRAREGMEPFKEPYKGARAIAVHTQGAIWITTKDRAISTPQDLAGKRIMLTTRGTDTAWVYEWLFKRWGIFDTLDLSYGGVMAQVDSLTDGLVDGIGTSFGVSSSPGGQPPFQLSGLTIKLFSSRPNIGWVATPLEDIEAFVKESGFPIATSTIPAGTFDKFGVKQPEPVPGWGNVYGWWADVEMDEDIVYEVTKTIYENADKFAESVGPAGALVTQQTLSRVNVPEELFHPSAAKLYSEKGLKMGY